MKHEHKNFILKMHEIQEESKEILYDIIEKIMQQPVKNVNNTPMMDASKVANIIKEGLGKLNAVVEKESALIEEIDNAKS